MTRIFLALLISALSYGCANRKAFMPDNCPDSLYYEFIGLPGGGIDTYELSKSGTLIFRSKNGHETKRQNIPNQTQWDSFYRLLEKNNIWEWKTKYSTRDNDPKSFVSDGFLWKFRLSKGLRRVLSEGDNAIPCWKDPKLTASDFSDVYDTHFGRLGQLQIALDQLMKKQKQ